MRTAFRLFYSWLVVTGLLLTPGHSGSSILIIKNNASFIFPQYVKFQIDVSSEAGIQKAILIYGTDQLSCQSTSARQALDFLPGKQVSLEWKLEFLRSGVIPPGAEIWWQWEITDASGHVTRTERKNITVQDERYAWQRLSRKGITVQWHKGSTNFGQAILNYAENDLKRISSQMAIQSSKQIWIDVYASTAEMRAALVRSDDWVGAVALPDYGVILLGLAPSELSYADYYLAHELTHLVVGELTFNCLGVEVPTWLNEGLAEVTQGKPGQPELDSVILAIESGTLPNLYEIVGGFSADGDRARLEYTQSNLAVEYLLQTYGPEKMSALLAAFRSGQLTDDALLQVYGQNTAGVDAAWRKSLGFTGGTGSRKVQPTRALVPTMALWTAAVRPTQRPTVTPQPTPTRTSCPTETPASPVSTTAPQTASPVSDPPDQSLISSCLGILLVPILLCLFLIRKKESVP